jgi:uncharacterized protein YijF (DUF1287 family)
MAHMNQFDFMVAQLGKNREKMPAVNRKTIASAVLAHNARNQFAAIRLGHQQILLDYLCLRARRSEGPRRKRLRPTDQARTHRSCSGILAYFARKRKRRAPFDENPPPRQRHGPSDRWSRAAKGRHNTVIAAAAHDEAVDQFGAGR